MVITKESKTKGFTLIEIVIVLAIAALILVAVLLAVNGAQKSRRDTQRKSDLARVLANVEQVESNSNGVPPAALPAAATSGMTDPLTGGAYTTAGIVTPASPSTAAGIQYQVGTGAAGGPTACDGTTTLTTRQVVLKMGSEGVGTLCVDDH